MTNGETPLYRIQFTGTTTGETDGAFEVFRGDAAAVEVGTATRIDTATVRASSDAQLTLWKGTDAQQVYTQPSNTFTGLMTGVDVTVSKVTAADEAPTTITVAQDTDALKKLGSDLVNSLNVVLSEIASRSAVTTTTNSDGTTSVKGGLFTGETAVRAIQQQLSEAASYPVDGFSPSVAGITLKKDGTFTFDEAAFTKAFADDPAKVQTVLAGVAERVAEVATDVSDKYEAA